MNRRRILPILLVAVGLVLGVFVSRTISGSTNAQQSNTNDRWEYCVISGVNYDPQRRIHLAAIYYFRTSGYDYVAIEQPELDQSDYDSILKTFAKASATLGQNGWEMVGDFKGYGDKVQQRLYFKRRLR